MHRVVMALIGMLAGVALLSACGDGNNDNERAQTVGTPAPAVTAAGNGNANAPDLSRALLRLDDLPSGWTTRPASASGTPSMLCGTPLFATTSQAKQAVEFERSELHQVVHTVAAYPDGEGKRVMDAAVNTIAGCTEWTDTDSQGRARRFRAAPLSFPKLGDQTLAFRLTVEVGGATAQTDAVYIRRDDLITSVAQIAAGFGAVQTDAALTEQLARKAGERLSTID